MLMCRNQAQISAMLVRQLLEEYQQNHCSCPEKSPAPSAFGLQIQVDRGTNNFESTEAPMWNWLSMKPVQPQLGVYLLFRLTSRCYVHVAASDVWGLGICLIFVALLDSLLCCSALVCLLCFALLSFALLCIDLLCFAFLCFVLHCFVLPSSA